MRLFPSQVAAAGAFEVCSDYPGVVEVFVDGELLEVTGAPGRDVSDQPFTRL